MPEWRPSMESLVLVILAAVVLLKIDLWSRVIMDTDPECPGCGLYSTGGVLCSACRDVTRRTRNSDFDGEDEPMEPLEMICPPENDQPGRFQ